MRGFRSRTTSHTRALTVSTTQSSPSTQCLKSSRPTMMGTRSPQESREKRDQKLYLQPTCTTQDVVSSMSGSAMKRAAKRPPVTAKGVPEQRNRYSGRCPLPVLRSVPFPLLVHSNVPVLRLGVPMSRGSNVPREGKPC